MKKDSPTLHVEEKKKVRTLVVLGSGGHTAEMLHLIAKFNQQVFQFSFLLASSDRTSFLQLSSSSSFSSSLRNNTKTFKEVTLEEDKKRKKDNEGGRGGEEEEEGEERDCLNVFSIPRSRE
ncbi:glycosyl transferase, partial [Cystoisospora suis]